MFVSIEKTNRWEEELFCEKRVGIATPLSCYKALN